MIKRILLALIHFYQRAISPVMPPSCRFTPTCSEYMYQAVSKYGALSGFWMGIKRLVRCNPFCPGGYDPVP
ncbi:MAG: membrane protein insertion efficiency factor YidD [Chloroflexi bacterium]|nr:membrane protein insertion efficiency factor YidD [Chloroflexota bacterium]